MALRPIATLVAGEPERRQLLGADTLEVGAGRVEQHQRGVGEGFLGHHLHKALRWPDATTADPFAGVKAPKDDTPAWEKRKPYSYDEIQQMREKARPVDHAIVLLGAHAGLRVAEMVDLEWRDVNLSAAELIVRCGKGGKRRTVHMSPGLVMALWRLPRTVERVLGFTSTSRARARMRRLAHRMTASVRPLAAAASTMARAEASVSASGFSHSTWQPASRAAIATSRWDSGTVQSNTTSGRTWSSMARRSVPVGAGRP